ncbi:MAG: MFS transporter [Alphaproteobacteria bacterium]|nr:MFS transporter [Alphaproteobacteria bacterium]
MTDEAVFRKCAWRLLPLITAGFFINFLDRTNVGFAALTMNRELGFTPSVYGFGAGIFFISYSIFQIPANLMLHRIGARRWLFLILVAWGATAAVTALVQDATSFYVLRFLVGMAEAGFFPGIILYLTFWFPKRHLGRFTSIFMCANPVSFVIGGPIASAILSLDGTAGLHGWQWLFILEGVPACVAGIAILNLLPDRPMDASWLTDNERRFVSSTVAAEQAGKEERLLPALLDPRVSALAIAYGGILFAIYGFGFWLPQLVQAAGFSTTATGFVVALLYVAAAPAMILWARFSDSRDERIWHSALAVLVAALGLLVASTVHNSIVMLISLAVTGTAMYSALTPFYGLASSLLSGPAMAGGIALINMFGGILGGFVGQYVIGIVRAKTGSYGPALVMIAASLGVAALIILALGRVMNPHLKGSLTGAEG